ncbi:MAG: nitroreductase family deazaflavin-dependent oxidoreductase [Acidobacteriota bacterium]
MKLKAIDRFFNRAFGLLVRIGFGLKHNHLLEVRGRKSGRIYSTPVNVLERDGARYIVAPRGYTQWVRNVLSNGEASLVKGRRREKIRLQPVAKEKAEILKAYLDRYKLTVQRYFPVPAGSPAEMFEPLAEQYPVFEVKASE